MSKILITHPELASLHAHSTKTSSFPRLFCRDTTPYLLMALSADCDWFREMPINQSMFFSHPRLLCADSADLPPQRCGGRSGNARLHYTTQLGIIIYKYYRFQLKSNKNSSVLYLSHFLAHFTVTETCSALGG